MKRLISLALVLCMLILAVPVFALPALAVDEDLTLNFRLSPTATSGQDQVGQLVSSTKAASAVLPTNEQVAAAHDANAPYKFTADEIISWYTWDAESWSYVDVEDYIYGRRTATGTLDFYPITESSATVPWYTTWIAGENQVIWESVDTATSSTQVLKAFTGGWSFGVLEEGKGYFNLDIIKDFGQGSGGYLATYVGSTDEDYRAPVQLSQAGQWVAPGVTLTYHATKAGTVDLYLPRRYAGSGYAAVAVNDNKFINVAASLEQGGKAVFVDADLTTENAEANKFAVTTNGDIVSRTTRYSNADVINLDVAAGDQIHFIEVGGTNSYWYPAVEYTKFTATLDTMRFSFYESPKATNAINNFGTRVATYTGIDNVVIPAENEAYLGWFWWDNENETYIEASEYIADCRAGKRELQYHSCFYPIQKDSTTVPVWSGWIEGENQAIVKDGALLAYTGGWSYGAWTDDGYAMLDTLNGNFLQAGADETNKVNIGVGSGSFNPSAEEAVVLTYHATVKGTVTVGIPHSYYAMYLAVAYNDALIWPNNDADLDAEGIQPIKATNANAKKYKTNPGNNTGLVVNRDTRYNNLVHTIELNVEVGDKIHFMMYQASGQPSIWWYPQVLYTKLPATLETMQVSFYQSPTTTNGIDNLGTKVATCVGIDNVVIPELGDEYLGWYWWDNTNKTFVEAGAYLAACRAGTQKILDNTYFYPIAKDSTTVPWYANWITCENQAITQNGELLAYTGGWSYGAWTDAGYKTLDTVNGNFLQAGTDETNKVNISSEGGFNSSSTSAVVLTYHVTVNGKVAVGIPHAYTYTELAIAHNGKIVWPVVDGDAETEGVQPMDILATNQNGVTYKGHPESNTALVVDRTTRYDNLTTTINLDVTAGETIQFMIYKSSGAAWWYPQVLYTEVAGILPGLKAGVVVDQSLAIKTEVVLPAGVDTDEKGIMVDGKPYEGFEIKVVAKNAHIPYVIKPYYVLNGETVFGEEQTLSVNGMLTDYANDPESSQEIKAAAEAALAYTAAAKAYFAGETVDAPATTPTAKPDGYTDASGDEYLLANKNEAATVGIRYVSLLLNDVAEIKVVADTTDTKYKLKVSSDAEGNNVLTTLTGVLTEDGGGLKFRMDRITTLGWNNLYYFTVVDENGAAVSSTLRYGVSVYYVRMSDKEDANFANLMATMMNFHEAVAAAAAASK